jgi:predicted DNA-binding protein
VSPAHGRPPSKDPKIHDTKIRMSDNDVEMLEYCCVKIGKKKAEIIRMGIRKVYEEIKNKND